VTAAINIQSRPTPIMWEGDAVLVDRRYLATEQDAAIVTEGDEQIFVYEQTGVPLKSEDEETLKSESGADLMPEP
jgi:hypothetical protein